MYYFESESESGAGKSHTCVYVDESYSVPLDVEISVEVKPRTLSGVVLSVFSHGAGPPGGDFLVLQLVNGQVSHDHHHYFL